MSKSLMRYNSIKYVFKVLVFVNKHSFNVNYLLA